MSRGGRPAIIHLVHSLAGGGTERTLAALLQAFDPTRLRHIVVTLRAAGPLSAHLPGHVACRAFATQGRSFTTGLTFAKLVRRWGAAVIHARNTGCWHDATMAKMLAPRARLVLGFHGLESADPFNRRRRWCAGWASRVGARFATVSKKGRRQLQTQAGIPGSQIDLLQNGVDSERFARLEDEARRQMRIDVNCDPAAFIVGTVSSLTPIKQHHVLLRALSQISLTLPNVQLLIVGDGPLRASLGEQAHAEGLQGRVRFTGWREDVPALLGCMDAYVCTSASEGMNNALLEAMAAGLPIIATDVGDNALIIRHGVEGHIVQPGCHRTVGEALRMLVGNPDARRRLAAAAKIRAGRFDFDDTVRAYESYYEGLLTGH